MPEIAIYDSQGTPVKEGQRGTNERIRDFFFDGIRLSMDTTGNTVEIVCFFRARETEASRSEQYYAVFNAQNIGDASRFGEVVESRVEDELGLLLDTSTDDTAIFELLRSNGSPSNPLSWTEVDEILTLIDTGTRATIGTPTYREAIGVLQEFVQKRKRGRYAIAENADSSHLSDYDLVVEKGSYDGVEILGETREKLEERKRRKQQERQESIEQNTSHSRGNLLRAAAVVFIVVGGIAVLATVLCIMNVSVPILGGSGSGCNLGLVTDPVKSNESTPTPTATPTPTPSETSTTTQEERLKIDRSNPSNANETVERGKVVEFKINVSVDRNELKRVGWSIDGNHDTTYYHTDFASPSLTWNNSFDESGNTNITVEVEDKDNRTDVTSWNITVKSAERPPLQPPVTPLRTTVNQRASSSRLM